MSGGPSRYRAGEWLRPSSGEAPLLEADGPRDLNLGSRLDGGLYLPKCKKPQVKGYDECALDRAVVPFSAPLVARMWHETPRRSRPPRRHPRLHFIERTFGEARRWVNVIAG